MFSFVLLLCLTRVLYIYYRHFARLISTYSGKNSKVFQSCCKSFGSKGLRLAPGAGPDISPYGIRVYDLRWQGMQIPDFAGISATTLLHFLHFLSTIILTIFLIFFIIVLYPVCYMLSTPIWGFFCILRRGDKSLFIGFHGDAIDQLYCASVGRRLLFPLSSRPCGCPLDDSQFYCERRLLV